MVFYHTIILPTTKKRDRLVSFFCALQIKNRLERIACFAGVACKSTQNHILMIFGVALGNLDRYCDRQNICEPIRPHHVGARLYGLALFLCKKKQDFSVCSSSSRKFLRCKYFREPFLFLRSFFCALHIAE